MVTKDDFIALGPTLTTSLNGFLTLYRLTFSVYSGEVRGRLFL